MDKNSEENKNYISQVLSDFRTNTNERLRLPIFQFYLITLIIYNWDLILFLIIDKNEILTKIYFIKDKFYSNNRYLIPLILSILYSLLFPTIQFYIIKVQRKFNNKRIEWDYDNQTSNANHKKKLQNILTGIQEKEDFEKQLDFEKQNNKNLKIEIQNLRDQLIIFQNTKNETTSEINTLNKNYYNLVSNFKFFLSQTSDFDNKIKEIFGEDNFFKYVNILIEIFNYSDIHKNMEIQKEFTEKLYEYLTNNNQNFNFSNNKIIDENIKKHIDNILIDNQLISKNKSSVLGEYTSRNEDFSNFINFMKELYHIE